MRAKDFAVVTLLLVGAGLCVWRGLAPAPPTRLSQPPFTQVSSQPTTRVVVKEIESVTVGQRVVGKNPLREQVETRTPESETWRELRLHMRKPSGASLWITLIRPDWWVELQGAEVGASIDLELPEMGALGPAEVTYLGPCPEIAPGAENPVVTGTFKHEVDENSRVVHLRLEGQSEPTGVTDNHPYWSVDRQAFTPAGELRVGETVNTVNGETRVTSVETVAYEGFVYNLETTEHVYRVGPLGTLVHNSCSVDPRHHVFPQEFRDDFERLGIEIDKYTQQIPASQHAQLHNPPNGWGWNDEWGDFFNRTPDPTANDAIEFAMELMHENGLSDVPLVPFR